MNNRRVYKYELLLVSTLRLPKDYRVVRVAEQRGVATIWIEVNVLQETFYRQTFEIFGTGWDIPDDAAHVASWESDVGDIWHLYQRGVRHGTNHDS